MSSVHFGLVDETFPASELMYVDENGNIDVPDSLLVALMKGDAFIIYEEGEKPPFPGALQVGVSPHWLCEVLPVGYVNPYRMKPKRVKWQKWTEL
jgi:hypothetical protein